MAAGVSSCACDVQGPGRICHLMAALAAPDEVLVSSTVRDLVVGSGIAFVDRGSRVLKGVPGRWRLYAADTCVSPRPTGCATTGTRSAFLSIRNYGEALMEPWMAIAFVITLAAIVIDRTRAYRFLPVVISRLRRRRRR